MIDRAVGVIVGRQEPGVVVARSSLHAPRSVAARKHRVSVADAQQGPSHTVADVEALLHWRQGHTGQREPHRGGHRRRGRRQLQRGEPREWRFGRVVDGCIGVSLVVHDLLLVHA